MIRPSVTSIPLRWRQLGSLLLVLCLLVGVGQLTGASKQIDSLSASILSSAPIERYEAISSLPACGPMALQNARELPSIRVFHLAGVLPELSSGRSFNIAPAFFRIAELRAVPSDDDFGLLPLPHGPPFLS